ncbi:PDZ domain-containing protein [Streptomyces sp. NBC_00257]|uniref:YlbL family protein n=1 Tax=Streptomyces TaxID=1883 RepID=UPI0022582A8B|nr:MULTISPECIES: PDZ domain-containing protein [unclassified Streptomyces]WTB56650.1 PDZ domain-containing protein [Streptomyces sp. NBC_00826]WTH90467.1 PDZ domain-containing protein [Streptomyces sp. NBC_00825]WTH99194.1 PDZ domain-containing protein [Streptomyces sp. NBC_00822]MCX4864619.1 PDZ domain-containing protein [Streptomyces sp. NBC_00906]MCX4895857.1 PDZ domain-containing protein [Streptomyces sp. NBC_00892]
MPRRTATMLASTLVLIALLCAGVLIKVPYSEMSPGPTVNTLGEVGGEPVLQISGHKTYPTSGNLNMTTVRVTGADYSMNLVESVYGWLAHDSVVVPHDTLYPDGKTEQQSTQENAEEFNQSQESAKVAALNELKIPVTSRVVVSTVVKDSPAQGKLHAGDVIKQVDGTPVEQPEDVAKLVTRRDPGQKVTFTVVPAKTAEAAEKAGKEPEGSRKIVITTVKAPKEDRAIVGIQAGTDHTFPFRIDIKLADVGGPSAGLMFSLGIIDKLTPGKLTGGKFIAGTGTIDDKGKVGPIGGINMKLVGARDAGARYFLTPDENCKAAASDTPSGLTLVRVKTIDDAKKSLEKIKAGDTAGLPSCSAG